MIKLAYRVHSVALAAEQVDVTIDGQQMQATRPLVVVELLDGDRHGHTFRLPAAGREAAEATAAAFRAAREVLVTLDPVAGDVA